jgi:hypothetical protein
MSDIMKMPAKKPSKAAIANDFHELRRPRRRRSAGSRSRGPLILAPLEDANRYLRLAAESEARLGRDQPSTGILVTSSDPKGVKEMAVPAADMTAGESGGFGSPTGFAWNAHTRRGRRACCDALGVVHSSWGSAVGGADRRQQVPLGHRSVIG